MTAPVVLTLTAPRLLEDKIVEALLAEKSAGAAGFTVHEVQAYGHTIDFRTVAEQVSGRVRQIEVRIVLPAEHVQGLVDRLGQLLRGQHIQWQISAVMAAGELGQGDSEVVRRSRFDLSSPGG